MWTDMADASDAASLAAALLRGDRRALARAITIAESTRPDHRAAAEALLSQVLPYAGQALRLGISGAPGVGKSTFIDAFGMAALAAGHRVAVLAVDPTSKRGGGSILGDKTRMPELSRHAHAFIRPSPAGRTLGGVARRTREAILLAEAAGFDRIIVETVGVGQSETEVADMVDLFLLLIAPGGGDELQGIKRGIVELANIVIVTKADGDLEPAARRAVADYRHALHLLRPVAAADAPEVISVSALHGIGVEAALAVVERRGAALAASGELARRRARQAIAALWSELGQALLEAMKEDSGVAQHLAALEAQVAAQAVTPAAAARAALEAFLHRGRHGSA
jgi:LAO/AO transport system kinase